MSFLPPICRTTYDTLMKNFETLIAKDHVTWVPLFLWHNASSSCRCMGEEGKLHKVLVAEQKGKRPLGRPRYRCDQNGFSGD
jgi:hypothetical protein